MKVAPRYKLITLFTLFALFAPHQGGALVISIFQDGPKITLSINNFLFILVHDDFAIFSVNPFNTFVFYHLWEPIVCN